MGWWLAGVRDCDEALLPLPRNHYPCPHYLCLRDEKYLRQQLRAAQAQREGQQDQGVHVTVVVGRPVLIVSMAGPNGPRP